MITTKTLTRTALVLLAGTLAPAAAHAAIDISDSATYYDPENWYAIRNGGAPTLTSDEVSIAVGNMKYDSMFFCYFSPVVLSAGEYFKISGNLTLSGLYEGTATTNTVLGLFDSKSYPQDTLDSVLSANSLNNAYNSKDTTFSASVVTNSMVGFLTSTSLAYNRDKTTASSTCIATNAGGSKIGDYSSAFAAPEANTAYAFELIVTKEAAGTYECAFSLGGGDVQAYTGIKNDNLEKIDVFAAKLPVVTGGSITLMNLSVATTGTVIPEPSAFGLLAGAFALALAGTRRRRRR